MKLMSEPNIHFINWNFSLKEISVNLAAMEVIWGNSETLINKHYMQWKVKILLIYGR